MCMPKAPKAPPAPEIIPDTPPRISNATTKKDAPKLAGSTSNTAQRKRRGRGTLRIPLANITGSGVNFPTP